MEDFLKFMASALNDYLSKLDSEEAERQAEPETDTGTDTDKPSEPDDNKDDDNKDDDKVSDDEAEQIRKIVEGV